MLTVSFSEAERYDINIDDYVVTFMGTTSIGSYHATAVVDKTLVKKRHQFKEKVIELMQSGLDPGEIEFD